MRESEFTFLSVNTASYAKKITALVVEPESVGPDTGLMHFAHGWGGNRFQYQEMMRDFAERYDLVCVATEYRQSGYDFDPETGHGAYRPYDASHYQVVDCMGTVREALVRFPVNPTRLFAFGGSQGGHITLLMAEFCPRTFGMIVAGSALTYLDQDRMAWTGRMMSPDELAVRDTVRMAPRIDCPVVLMHGTADETVPDRHTRVLEAALRRAGKEVVSRYIEGGKHMLEPITNRHTVTKELADEYLRTIRTDGSSVFSRQERVVIPCATQSFVLDWSRETKDPELMGWER
jgi:dienelactone hydrolase